MMPNLRTLIVIPAFNEEGKIGRVISKIPPNISSTILVVDDYSNDQTFDEASATHAVVIRHAHNLGVGAAIRTGIDFAIEKQFDIIAILSGDDQHDPQELKGLISPIVNLGYDFVQGSRRLGGLDAPNIGWFRRFFTWFYAVTFRLLTGFRCTDATNGGRAFRTAIFQDKTINLWQDWLNTYELEPYLFFMVVKRKFKVIEAPMKVIYHSRGTTKMKPIRDWWRIFCPMVYLSLGLKK